MNYPVANLDGVILRIAQTLDLRAVVTERYGVALEPAGERWRGECFLRSTVEGFTGLCADQDASEHGTEKPANLWVSVGERSYVWRCHSCQRRGDVVDLIGYADAIDRNGGQVGLGAVRRAAEMAGLAWLMDGEPGPRAGRDVASLDFVLAEPIASALRSGPTVDVDTAFELNSFACKKWRAALHESDSAARAAHEYLVSRGVTSEQMKIFGLGFARKGDTLARVLTGMGTEATKLAATLGLIKQTRDGTRWYDSQRERIVFPYVEPGAKPLRITGFAGRSLIDPRPPNVPKWLNSETVPGVWSKKSALLGLHTAVRLTGASRRAALSEGGLDVIAWYGAEIPAVSPVGVDFTVQHATVLQRLGFESVTICFDGDSGGRRNVLVAVASFLAVGFTLDSIHVIDLADGLDPDDLTRDEMERAWDCPISVLEFVALHAEELATRPEAARSVARYLTDEAIVRELFDLLGLDVADARGDTLIVEVETTSGQRLVRALLAHATSCAFVSAHDVEAMLIGEPHLQARLRSVRFGEQTCEDRLPIALRRSLIEGQLSIARVAFAGSADLWRYGDSIEDYRRAWDEREQLRTSVESNEKRLATVDGQRH